MQRIGQMHVPQNVFLVKYVIERAEYQLLRDAWWLCVNLLNYGGVKTR